MSSNELTRKATSSLKYGTHFFYSLKDSNIKSAGHLIITEAADNWLNIELEVTKSLMQDLSVENIGFKTLRISFPDAPAAVSVDSAEQVSCDFDFIIEKMDENSNFKINYKNVYTLGNNDSLKNLAVSTGHLSLVYFDAKKTEMEKLLAKGKLQKCA
ncbi:MAG: hypothetical protein MHMPM18_000303 [Marteilia pararefringens]